MYWWAVVKVIWVCLAISGLCVVMIIYFRSKGLLSWRKALREELNHIKKRSEALSGPALEAHKIINVKCSTILSSNSPEIGDLKYLFEYIQSIAACYFPQTDRPELQITLGALLNSLDVSLERFDRILKRPVFRKLNTINIRQVNHACEWYTQIKSHDLYRLYSNHRQLLKRIGIMRYVIFFDPLTWAAFLSSKLTTLILVKHLLVDLYLFFGGLAVTAFEYQGTLSFENHEHDDPNELEGTLEELNELKKENAWHMTPEILKLRSKIVGLTSVIKSDPGFGEWKEAVVDASHIIAREYFPESKKPIEEASLGPLLERSMIWIDTLRKGEELFWARRFYKVRLHTIYRAKTMSDLLLPVPIRQFIDKSMKTFDLLKWPLRVYRWVKKRSPWIVALDVGWIVAKKAGFVHIYGRAFDKACMELDIIYAKSKKHKEKKSLRG